MQKCQSYDFQGVQQIFFNKKNIIQNEKTENSILLCLKKNLSDAIISIRSFFSTQAISAIHQTFSEME